MTGTAKHHPRTKPPEERRAELVNAAEQLFLEQGVAPTTIEQITSRAGVAKGTFYLYFSTKEDVRGALGERYAQEHLAAIKAAIAEGPPEDFRRALSNWARASAAFYLGSIQLHDICFHESLQATRDGLVHNSVIDHLAELLRAGAEAGAWSIDDSNLTAIFLFSGIHGVVDNAIITDRRIDRSRLVEALEQLCSRLVGPKSC